MLPFLDYLQKVMAAKSTPTARPSLRADIVPSIQDKNANYLTLSHSHSNSGCEKGHRVSRVIPSHNQSNHPNLAPSQNHFPHIENIATLRVIGSGGRVESRGIWGRCRLSATRSKTTISGIGVLSLYQSR